MGRRASPRWPWRWSPPPSSSKKRMFQIGSEVEVRSDEDGFSDGWFEATITRMLYKQRRYAVSYDNIVADDASEKPLTETVHCSLIRPRPSADPTDTVFEIYQCVEAFHNEGWWPGVVCKLLDGGCDRLYSVYFPATREEFQFKASELRRRLEWVKGKWVSVEEAQEGVHWIGEGTQVEVSRDKENFGAAWFVGTVLKVIGSRYFLVEYENIRVYSDGGTDMLLKEIVDLQYIRPCPPASMVTSFDIRDEVEGFHRDGWFSGVVSAILPGSRYIVKYKHQEDEMVLDHTSLRPGRVWDDEHWVDISRDCKVKTPAPRGTKPAVHKRKSSSGTISASAAGNDDHVSEGSNFPSVKRKKKDGPRKKSRTKSSQVRKKSKKRSLSGSLSVPVPTYKENDGETTDGSDVASFKIKEATRPSVKGGLELCESVKKLKEGNLIEKTVSIYKRLKSLASEQSSLYSPVVTSHNNDSEVSDIFYVMNLKDRNVEEPGFQDNSSQMRKKSEKGKTLEEHLQSVDGALMDWCSNIPATVGKGAPDAMPMLERSPSLVSGELQPMSTGHESSAQKSKVGLNSQVIPLSRELCHGQETSDVNGTNESVNIGNESYGRLGEGPEAVEANLVHLPVWHEAVDIVPIADCGNGKDNSSPPKTNLTRKRKLTVRPPRRQGKTPDVADVKQHTQEVEEHSGCVTPVRKITFKNKNSPRNDGNDDTSSHKQSRIMVDACVTLIESSILNAESVKYSAVQQSPSMKSLPSRGEDVWSCASRVAANEAEGHEGHHEALPSTDSAHNHGELIMSHKVAEMENASNAPMQVIPRRLLYICREQEISPRRLLYEESVVEKKQGLCNATPCGSLPTNEDTNGHDELIPTVFPSGISSSFVSRSGEIQDGIMEPGETGRKRGSHALRAGLPENIAPESNQLALTGPQSDGVVFKSGETAVADPLPRELSEKLVLPFSRGSELWEYLESREVFRSLPQQPHFHPLHQYDKELREGMAIGLMVTFASLVGDISSMRTMGTIDFKQDLEVKMKILGHLESHGFNVGSIRARLERVLQLRSRLSRLEVKKLSLGRKLTASEEEAEQNSLLMFSVEQTMSELEQKLAHLGKKRSALLHELHKTESEIAILKRGVQEAEEANTSTNHELDSVLTAPW